MTCSHTYICWYKKETLCFKCLLYHVTSRDCPNDINEAVSTLIYASAWCGDLPELRKIQKLFGERYGRKFVKAAVELYHGTLVNCQVSKSQFSCLNKQINMPFLLPLICMSVLFSYAWYPVVTIALILQIREKLCLKSIPYNVKLRLMDEIAKDYSLQHLPKVFLGHNRLPILYSNRLL